MSEKEAWIEKEKASGVAGELVRLNTTKCVSWLALDADDETDADDEGDAADDDDEDDEEAGDDEEEADSFLAASADEAAAVAATGAMGEGAPRSAEDAGMIDETRDKRESGWLEQMDDHCCLERSTEERILSVPSV